jgi:hypothetical protein
MKKLLGFFLCMGILLSGLTVAYGSPPGNEKAQHETTTVITDAPDIETELGLSASDIETLRLVSHQAAEQATLDLRAEIAMVTDAPFDSILAELQANAVNRVQVTGPKSNTRSQKSVHRWRSYPKGNDTPVYVIYRPGWNRKVCEG